MKRAWVWTLSLWVAGLAGCSTSRVSIDYDRTADFSRYRTYAWMQVPPSTNPLDHKRAATAVAHELEVQGLRPATGAADLLVAVYTRVDIHRHVDRAGYGYPWGYWGGYGWSPYYVYDIPVGTLIVDLVAASKKELLWRGVASDALKDTPEKSESSINQGVAKMFKKFPPKK